MRILNIILFVTSFVTSAYAQSKITPSSVFQYIQDSILGGYPIFGTRQDLEKWTKNEFSNRFYYKGRDYSTYNFSYKNHSIFNNQIMSSKSYVEMRTRTEGNTRLVDYFEINLSFANNEFALTYLEKAVAHIKQLNPNQEFNLEDDYALEQGIVNLKWTDKRVRLILVISPKTAVKPLIHTDILEKLPITKHADIKETLVESLSNEYKIERILPTQPVKKDFKFNTTCQNRCLRFDGKNDYLSIARGGPYNEGQSVEFLMALSEYAPSKANVEDRPEIPLEEVIDNFTTLIQITYVVEDGKYPTTQGRFKLGYIGKSIYTHHIEGVTIDKFTYYGSEFRKDEWYHIAFSHFKGQFSFYVNENQIDALQTDESNAEKFIKDIQILDKSDSREQFFEGFTDELRVWKRGLSPFEVQDYAYKTILTHPDLVLNYHFDEGLPYSNNTTIKNITNTGISKVQTEFSADKKGDMSNYVCSDLALKETRVWLPPTLFTDDYKLNAPDRVFSEFVSALKTPNGDWKKYILTATDGQISVPNLRLWTEMFQANYYGHQTQYRISSDGNSAELLINMELTSKKIPELTFSGMHLVHFRKVNGVWKIAVLPG